MTAGALLTLAFAPIPCSFTAEMRPVGFNLKHAARLLGVVGIATLLGACAQTQPAGAKPVSRDAQAVSHAIQSLQARFAPDPYLRIYRVEALTRGKHVTLRGEVDDPQAKAETLAAVRRAGLEVTDRLAVLPSPELGDATWGISCLSVANGREEPRHSAELGTQILMGQTLRVWTQTNRWFLVQSSDGYLAWMPRGAFVRCTKSQMEAWTHSPLLLVTAFEERVLEQPQPEAQPVSDVVTGCFVKRTGEAGDWFQVELPDRRTGFLPKSAAVDHAGWRRSRRATPDSIERTAKTFLGRPYLWGGNSPKGLDCSGFTKLVFFLNGLELDRNASHQAQQGVDVPLDDDLRQLRKGDLIFFGARARGGRPERISHVGIYLGNQCFIQSSDRVHISSLDPQSPIYDEHWSRSLLRARRLLPGS